LEIDAKERRSNGKNYKTVLSNTVASVAICGQVQVHKSLAADLLSISRNKFKKKQ